MEKALLSIYIINGVIILITLYLIFLYIKSKTFRIYPCYNLLIMSIIIFYDNLIRIIPLRPIKAIGGLAFFKYVQAFLLTLMDKLLLATITSQCIITYLGVCHTRFYFKSERQIFTATSLIGAVISIIITLIYIIVPGKLANYNDYFYCADFPAKKVFDVAFNCFFILLNFASILLLLAYMATKKKEVSLGLIEDLDYGHHYTRILLMLIVNSLLFIESFLIVFDVGFIYEIFNIDLLYLTSCLIILLYYTINKKVIQETTKIFCYNYYKKSVEDDKKRIDSSLTGDDDDDEDEVENRTESF